MTASIPQRDDGFVPQSHNHAHCVADAIRAATAVCQQRAARLTAMRRRVLELVWASHRPIGAYALLDHLREEGKASAPPTVYRALEFLLEHGLVHRIESLNAYVGCAHPGENHRGVFLICRACKDTVEIDDPRVARAINASAADRGFAVQHTTVEIAGLCPACREGGAA